MSYRAEVLLLGGKNGLHTALAEVAAERAAQTETERHVAKAARRAREAGEEARAAQLEREKAASTLAGLMPEEIRKAEELANWDFIKERQNIADLRDHLARFAGGGTERYARAKLEALIWADPATRGSITALHTFLDEFPKGGNAGAAKACVESLEREAAAAKARIKELRGGWFTRRGIFRLGVLASAAWILGWVIYFTIVLIRGDSTIGQLVVAPMVILAPPVALMLIGMATWWVFQGFQADDQSSGN